MEIKFIADVHLGKLAKYMRMLGFDVLYRNDFNFSELKQLAEGEQRILLSRKNIVPTQTLSSFTIESEDAFEQLEFVIRHFKLQDDIRPFTRCLICNGILHAVPKNEIIQQLEENTIKYYNEFWQCSSCHHIYWKGNHYERMMEFVKKFSAH